MSPTILKTVYSWANWNNFVLLVQQTKFIVDLGGIYRENSNKQWQSKPLPDLKLGKIQH